MRHLIKPILPEEQLVLSQIIKIGTIAFRYRKQLYKVLVAQDRAIGGAWRRGGYGRQTQYGVRHGLVAGTIAGTIINEMIPDTPNGALQKRTKPRNQYKKRPRNFRYTSSRNRYGISQSYNNRKFCKPRRREFSRARINY